MYLKTHLYIVPLIPIVIAVILALVHWLVLGVHALRSLLAVLILRQSKRALMSATMRRWASEIETGRNSRRIVFHLRQSEAGQVPADSTLN
jgi:hypothetical protein